MRYGEADMEADREIGRLQSERMELERKLEEARRTEEEAQARERERQREREAELEANRCIKEKVLQEWTALQRDLVLRKYRP